ncbi:hypothetical protein KFK09_000277 [Dendrobium nobile]|uniref:non-specific serine/threonine protein kinase n=1 Tax=Dendrobium nobile TaxID=94219 RepID=A0A8T3CDH9_DENNO|nr:hypothetical protein KFK09_000277 [Dendrobium nobile]
MPLWSHRYFPFIRSWTLRSSQAAPQDTLRAFAENSIFYTSRNCTAGMPCQAPKQMASSANVSMVLFFICCVSFSSAETSKDVQTLFTLRSSLSREIELIPSWFDGKTPPCQWLGVKCTTNHEIVEAIDLSFTPLNLPIPSCIGQFSSLKILNFSNCELFGQIPETLGHLWNLQYLDLSNNQLSGTVPLSLANSTKLKQLLLGSNMLHGNLGPIIRQFNDLRILSLSGNVFSGNLPMELGNLQKLQVLEFSMNSFTGSLPESLGNLTQLIHLDGSHNGFTGTFFFGLGSLVNLKTLDLSSNSFTGPLTEDIGKLSSLISLWLGPNGFNGSIPVEIGNLEQLEIFSIPSCKFTGKIPSEISKLKKITDLDISDNNIEGELPPGIGELTNLNYLVASHAGLTGKIPEELGNLKNLMILDLSFNHFYGPLPDSLFALESINSFLVDDNHLFGPIPGWLSNWSMARFISLEKNNFSGTLPSLRLQYLTSFTADANHLSGEIPADICEAESLSHLSLADNELTGSIHETFRGCSNLTDLILNGNKFFGQVPGYLAELPLVTLELSHNNFSGLLPSQLLQSETIVEIYLCDNQLSGKLPDSNGGLSLLRRLQLDNNYFEGVIPNSIGKLSNLTNLSLHGNKLSGGIPLDLFNCTNLVELDIGSNRLSGSIPKVISQLKLLGDLVFSNNLLSGEIPDEICAGFQLAQHPDSEFNQHYGVLDLSYNNLKGQIPKTIKNCVEVKELMLQGNKLNGIIPPELNDLLNLAVLDLSFNSLSGTLLSAQFSLKNLQGLLLSNNQLEGPIPDNLGLMMPSLVKLNLSSNRLTGPLPESLFVLKSLTHLDTSLNFLSGSISFLTDIDGGVSSLIIFNASNNLFSGAISESISNLTSLSILDLHNNNFTGSLPSLLSSLNSLTYLDVSNNNLQDAIPCKICSIVGLTFVNFSGNKFDSFAPESCTMSQACVGSHIISKPLVAYPSARLFGRALVWGIIISVAFISVLIFFIIIKWRRHYQKNLALAPANKTKSSAIEPASSEELLSKRLKEPVSINIATFEHALFRITLADIMKATNEFSKSHIIGDGGFGTVYKASLPENQVVAIKRLNSGRHFQGDREFLAEMETIGKVKHRNLVPLLGYCVFGEERFLIYEYMENGSLEQWLRKQADADGTLSWSIRLKICLGAARGLSFLHHGFVPHIIHRDMKSSNILLDQYFEPRVADFGLARIISACETHVTTDLAGTFGYIPPEYGLTMKATAKGDVYSFGVVLLELLTGRTPTGQEEEKGGGNLVEWVRWMEGFGLVDEVFDPSLSPINLWREQMMCVLRVAKMCTTDEPAKRPTMIEVVNHFKEIQMMDDSI